MLERLCDRLDAGVSALLAFAAGGPWRTALVVLPIALALILPGIAALPVTDRDEARFAQASKQMIETGDYVDIRFQDAPRWKKPAGIYWLQAASASLAGGAAAPIWAYRVPSALGILAAALLTAWAARPLVGPRAAALAAIMLPATLLALGEANIAKTDAALLATGVAALGAIARMATAPPGAPAPWGPVLVLWGALGIAGLLKGPIVPLVALLALLWLWLVARRPVALSRLKPVAGLALALAILMPWLVTIWVISEGRFFEESVGRDLLGKVAEGQEKHWGPPGLYLLLVWATLWPWAAMLPAAVPWLWARRRALWVGLLAGWVLPFWVVLEAVPTKLPHYVLPLYPALLIALAAWATAEDRPMPARWARRAGAWLVGVPGIALAIALAVGAPILEGRVLWAALALAVLGGGATLIAARAALAARPIAQAGAALVASIALAGGVLQIGLPALDTIFPSPRIAALAERWRACASGPLVTAGYREPSMVFHAGTETRLATPAEAARILSTEPGALVLLEHRWLALMDPYWDTRPDLVERERLSYFNYNRGDFETAALVTRPDPRWTPCAR